VAIVRTDHRELRVEEATPELLDDVVWHHDQRSATARRCLVLIGARHRATSPWS